MNREVEVLRQSSSPNDETLILREEVEKANCALESTRLQLHTKIEDLDHSQQAYNTVRFEKTKLEEQISRDRTQNQAKFYQLRELAAV